jgi:hypothetical protein
MAEIILGLLVIISGCACLLVVGVSFFGNAMGAATAPDQVDHRLTIIFAVLALVLFGTGGWLLS